MTRLRDDCFAPGAERRKAEDALRESEQTFRTLFESANDGMYIVGLDGTILDANRMAYERLGYTREEMLTMTAAQLIPSEFAPEVPKLMARVREQGQAIVEVVHHRKDGSTMEVEISSRTFEYKGRKAFLSMVRDLTSRRQLEAEMLRSQKLESLGVLAGGLAHDFNNSLMSILANVSLARQEISDETVADYLVNAEKSILQAKGITNQLLTFSRGGEPVVTVVVDVGFQVVGLGQRQCPDPLARLIHFDDVFGNRADRLVVEGHAAGAAGDENAEFVVA